VDCPNAVGCQGWVSFVGRIQFVVKVTDFTHSAPL